MIVTEFLLARIAEDEAVARRASHQKVAGPFHGNWVANSLHLAWMEREDAAHIARHDPARVLAECEAKRRLVRQSMQNINVDVLIEDEADLEAAARAEEGWVILRTLASIYSDHPDFDPAWRP